jgi:uncharacterized protein YjbI with pentapeptide repeats
MKKAEPMKQRFIAAALILFTGTVLLYGNAAAFNQKDLETLQQTQSCPNCDLSGVYLPGTNLTDANLNRASLLSTNLTGANLTGANLSYTIRTDGTPPAKQGYLRF